MEEQKRKGREQSWAIKEENGERLEQELGTIATNLVTGKHNRSKTDICHCFDPFSDEVKF